MIQQMSGGMKVEIDKTATKCVFCGSLPNRIHYEADLWYYDCSNKNCDKHPKYAYMGFRESSAREQWEWANRKLVGVKGRKQDADDNI